MPSISQEVAESPLEKILWYANEANSADYRSAAELTLRLRKDEARKCWKCKKWRVIQNFNLDLDGERKSHCWLCGK